jgi:hypothetical protein
VPRVQLGVDVDADALQIAASNCEQFEDLHVDFLHVDARSLPACFAADTVVTCAPAPPAQLRSALLGV